MNEWPVQLKTVPLPSLVAVSHPLTAQQSSLIHKFGSGIDEVAFQAGWALILGDQESAHELAQSIEGQGRPRNGDYWHAILHRREPDYSNAKYWFRSVGTHPVFPEVSQQADRILQQCADPAAETWRRKLTGGGWNPSAFVDLCRECAEHEERPLGIAARQIQWAEMLLLMRECSTALGLELELPEFPVQR